MQYNCWWYKMYFALVNSFIWDDGLNTWVYYDSSAHETHHIKFIFDERFQCDHLHHPYLQHVYGSPRSGKIKDKKLSYLL